MVIRAVHPHNGRSDWFAQADLVTIQTVGFVLCVRSEKDVQKLCIEIFSELERLEAHFNGHDRVSSSKSRTA